MTKLELLEPNDNQFGIHDYRNAEICNKTIILGAGDVADSLLGVRFDGCEVRIKSSGHGTGVILSQCHFENCVVIASKIQKIAILEASFNRCSFRGKYEVGFYSDVTACDFSGAQLNQCLFFKIGDVSECTWPGDGHLLISGLNINRDKFMQAVPQMSILWIMARKGPEAIALYKNSLQKVDARIWTELEERDYVCKL